MFFERNPKLSSDFFHGMTLKYVFTL